MEYEMSKERPGIVRRIFGGIYRAVDVARRFTVNMIFLAIAALVIAAWLGSSGRPRMQEDTALVLNIKGDVVEEYTGSAREAEFAEQLGGEARETQLRDVLAAIDGAAADARIARMVLVLDDMGHAGMAKLREIGAAIDRFKGSGKQVVAWASSMDQRQYYLASHASEAYLHPFGAVDIAGFGGYRNYYHDALEKLGVTVNVFRAGKFKSFGEPYTSNGPSKEAAEADAFWLQDAWAGYTADVETARHLPAGAIDALIAAGPARLAATGGNLARFAVDEKLVDGLKTRDELRAMMIERGKPDAEHHTFRQVSLEEYRAGIADTGDRSRQVGIIVAEGTISNGDEPQGSIGGRSTAELVRRAREDASIKALVLRVDSGGGSVFGSELIRRELELTRRAGKPVVVSMSDVAASGGYWVTTAADRVLADPATITGSIGVFSIFPTADRALEKLGIHSAGTTTTWLAGATDMRRPIDSRFATVLQSAVGYIYKEFIDRVSQARKMDPDKVVEVAQGRVWTGRQAQERGLVDEMGGLETAVRAAAGLAKLDAGYRTAYIEAEPRGWGRILAGIPNAAARDALAKFTAGLVANSGGAAAQVRDDLSFLASARAPQDVFAYCLCRAP